MERPDLPPLCRRHSVHDCRCVDKGSIKRDRELEVCEIWVWSVDGWSRLQEAKIIASCRGKQVLGSRQDGLFEVESSIVPRKGQLVSPYTYAISIGRP